MKRKIGIVADILSVLLFSLSIKKLPFWLLHIFENIGIGSYGMGVFILTTLSILIFFAVVIISGYFIIKPLLKSKIEHKKFWGVFLLCVLLTISVFDFVRVDILNNVYFKTTSFVEVYTELDGKPIIVHREAIGNDVQGDSRTGDYILLKKSGSKLYKDLNVEDKLYINVRYLTRYSYTIG